MLHGRVVVQEEDQLGACGLDPLVARTDEADVFSVAENHDARKPFLEPVGRSGRRGVVHDDHFELRVLLIGKRA